MASKRPDDLAGRRILITRAEEQAPLMAHAVTKRGGVPVSMAVVQIRIFDQLEGLASLDTYDHVVLPSVNAARALAAQYTTVPTPVVCVGDKTAAALDDDPKLRGVFVGPRAAPAIFRAEAILAHLDDVYAGTWPQRRLLLLRGDHGRDTLIDGIRERGATLDVVPAYELTHRIPSDVELAARFDVATFLSGATLDAYLAVVPHARDRLARVPVAVIGPVAKDHAEAVGIAVAIVPNRSTVEDLLDAIAQYSIEDS